MDTLISMGFDSFKAEITLKSCNNNVDEAIHRLLLEAEQEGTAQEVSYS